MTVAVVEVVRSILIPGVFGNPFSLLLLVFLFFFLAILWKYITFPA